MSKVVILRGISGAGKSTHAATNYPGAFVVSADSFFTFADGYKFDPTRLGAVHGRCLLNFLDAAQRGRNVVVDNTNISVEEIAPYYALAEAYGREVEIVWINTPYDIAAARCIHGISREAIANQLARLVNTRLPSRWRHRIVQ